MSLPLPELIERFMSSENTHDLEALADCFTLHATVTDERETMQGLEAIKGWSEPIAVIARDGKTVVSTKLTGDFPGSAITLDFVFMLEGGKIAALEIQL